MNPACSPKKFDKEVIIIPMAVATTCLEREFPTADLVNKEWFINFVDWWLRWFYTNNGKWKKKLKNGDIDSIHILVAHWAKAFAQNPERYKTNHRKTQCNDSEWQPGGKLG